MTTEPEKPLVIADTATMAWLNTLNRIFIYGQPMKPRGLATLDLEGHTVTCDMRYPVVDIPERKLSFQFMAAEAYWILSGSNKVDEIAPWSQKIADFSDDGRTFFGAYGPKVVDQLPYVVRKLVEDRDTRQAGLTIWRESPPATKDVPCTVAIFFRIVDGHLNTHVFMRSSDAWLGLPYDVFNFSMITYQVCCDLNLLGTFLTPGKLTITAVSSHLYETNHETAFEITETIDEYNKRGLPREAPPALYQSEKLLMINLEALRSSQPGSSLRWWEVR